MVTNIPEEFKLNRFKSVAVPKPRDYFARYGYIQSPSNLYSGDEPVSEHTLSKIENLVEGQKVVQKAIDEYNKSEK